MWIKEFDLLFNVKYWDDKLYLFMVVIFGDEVLCVIVI